MISFHCLHTISAWQRDLGSRNEKTFSATSGTPATAKSHNVQFLEHWKINKINQNRTDKCPALPRLHLSGESQWSMLWENLPTSLAISEGIQVQIFLSAILKRLIEIKKIWLQPERKKCVWKSRAVKLYQPVKELERQPPATIQYFKRVAAITFNMIILAEGSRAPARAPGRSTML